jgi:7,8-dihydropterin-6-yl-methyl-4-(beta-D-ribofuranosyl)aminobenzene 5'-phosphate synthase
MPLTATRDVAITTVVDNYSNALLKSEPGVIERHGPDKEPLLAEHGLCMHIRLGSEGTEILLDAGYSKVALPHNLSRLGIDPAKVSQVVISHGHRDHTAALAEFLRLSGRRVPVIVHADAFLERWLIFPDGTRMGPWQENARQWEQAGAEIIHLEKPYQLAPGCLVTGPVPRRADFEKGVPAAYYRKGQQLVHDPVNDDQAIVINVEGKGLVIVAGCAHSGIVNTVLYAREISGVKEVWAIVGGFHLGDGMTEQIERTIVELETIGPRLVAPAHCTGFAAKRRFAAQMPDQFLLNAVGSRLAF